MHPEAKSFSHQGTGCKTFKLAALVFGEGAHAIDIGGRKLAFVKIDDGKVERLPILTDNSLGILVVRPFLSEKGKDSLESLLDQWVWTDHGHQFNPVGHVNLLYFLFALLQLRQELASGSFNPFSQAVHLLGFLISNLLALINFSSLVVDSLAFLLHLFLILFHFCFHCL